MLAAAALAGMLFAVHAEACPTIYVRDSGELVTAVDEQGTVDDQSRGRNPAPHLVSDPDGTDSARYAKLAAGLRIRLSVLDRDLLRAAPRAEQGPTRLLAAARSPAHRQVLVYRGLFAPVNRRKTGGRPRWRRP